MANCIVAQSGGPSAVINATLAGILQANKDTQMYEHVYGGLYGVEGILQRKYVDLTELSMEEIQVLRQTPSSALGSCRYKLRRENVEDFEKIIQFMSDHDIETFFYIGGNDSIDAVAALTEYTTEKQLTQYKFIGCPQTVDNDLILTDHCPGFASSAKFIAYTALQCWYDLNVYSPARKEIFILETMGRDAGWLAASACLSNKVDILIVPEVAFDQDLFLEKVYEQLEEKSKCFIVVSEGAHYIDGTYLSARQTGNSKFHHAILGGAGKALEHILQEADMPVIIKVQELSTVQRSHATEQSFVDAEESFQMGLYAHQISTVQTGKVVCLNRDKDTQYHCSFTTNDADQVANYVKSFPVHWVLNNYQGISQEAIDYLRPLIQGVPDILYNDEGLPLFVEPYYQKNK